MNTLIKSSQKKSLRERKASKTVIEKFQIHLLNRNREGLTKLLHKEVRLTFPPAYPFEHLRMVKKGKRNVLGYFATNSIGYFEERKLIDAQLGILPGDKPCCLCIFKDDLEGNVTEVFQIVTRGDKIVKLIEWEHYEKVVLAD